MNDKIVNLIKNQIGSNGKKGWPVVARDRISFPSFSELIVTDANVGVAFLWTMRDTIVPKLKKENLAIAANFYTPAGIQPMIRNILGDPFIRYFILLGEEYSSKSSDDQASDLTSANAIRNFFEKGIDKNRKIKGFENAVYLDKNISSKLVEEVRKNVKFIDLNKKMPSASLDKKIKEANKLIKSFKRKEIFTKPQVFGYEQTEDSFPYEGGPIIVHGGNIPEAWIRMINNVYRYGKKNLMNADTDRWVKEINDMTVVIHNPQDMDLSVNPFLIPLTKAKIEDYKREILSPLLPKGKAYTYGNKLRAYYDSNPEKIKELVNTKEYKDFEYGQGKWLDKNIRYKKDYCEINQIKDAIDTLKRDPYSKTCVAITWHVADELMRKHKSSPCLVLLQALVQEEKLNLTVFFRSHDMAQGWPENAYGCAAIQEEVAKGIGVDSGLLTIISGSAQIYNNYYQQVEKMLKKYKKIVKGTCHDKRGNYQIKIEKNKIVITLLHPETGVELESYSGKTAYNLRDKIASVASLNTDHAIYLGTELAIAEICLKKKKSYNQDSTFKTSNLF